jgi:hypothetical protein
MKLVKVVPSHKLDKKLDAVFSDGIREKRVPFGAKGMDDYTITHDKAQRDRYRQRHKKDLETGDPTKAGFLSYYILWGESTSRDENIAKYKKRFSL